VNFGGSAELKRQLVKVLAISAKRKSPLGSTLEEYPVRERNISHARCFRRERKGLCFGAACEA